MTTSNSNRTRPAFLVTIDTEGDNLWSRPGEITTHNSHSLPRFQELCQRHGLPPSWLVNHEMACCPRFVEFGRDVLARGAGEIGMHLHAWNSPPLAPLTVDDFGRQPFLTEYPVAVMREKVRRLQDRLAETFGVPPRSHRAGRWAFDGRYARILSDCGFEVDCSVTPQLAWERRGDWPCVIDYSGAPTDPYHLDADDVCRPGGLPLLEVPVTIRPPRGEALWAKLRRSAVRLPGRLARRVAGRLVPRPAWLRPTGRNGGSLQSLLRSQLDAGAAHLQFMLHSSELMPGGSPRFPNTDAIERLYEQLESLFSVAAVECRGMTLSAFAAEYTASNDTAVA